MLPSDWMRHFVLIIAPLMCVMFRAPRGRGRCGGAEGQPQTTKVDPVGGLAVLDVFGGIIQFCS